MMNIPSASNSPHNTPAITPVPSPQPGIGITDVIALPWMALQMGLSGVGALTRLMVGRKYPLQVHADAMKGAELKCRWNALKAVAMDASLSEVKELDDLMKDKKTLKRRIARELSHVYEGKYDPRRFEDLLENYEVKDVQEACDYCIQSLPDKIQHQFNLQIKEESASYLDQKTRKILSYLTNSPDNLPETSKKIIHTLRKALKTEAYQNLKEQGQEKTIRLLQQIAVAMWYHVKVLPAYQDFGKQILKNLHWDNEQTLTGESIVNILTQAQEVVRNELYDDKGSAIVGYSLQHPTQTFQRLASEDGVKRTVAGMFGHSNYDPHAVVLNIPSVQGMMTMISRDKTVTAYNCYSGSPTCGDDIALEFSALLQGIENNLMSNVVYKEFPQFVLYINFQNLSKPGENARSRSIMELNNQFPIFWGITLSKDSKFYLGTEWKGIEDFGHAMKKALLDEISFSLKGRETEDDYGFYFPRKIENLEETIEQIIQLANKQFLTKTIPPLELRQAYQEYVYSLIQSYLEMYLANKLIDMGFINPSIMVIRACKENIDRGGAENEKYMYFNLPDIYFTPELQASTLSMLIGVLQGRPVAVRDRIVDWGRVSRILPLIRYVDRKEFREDLAVLMQLFGIDSLSYAPCLNN